MYFLASKTLGVLATPHYLAVLLVAAALLLRIVKRSQRWQRWLILAAVLELWVLGTGMVSNLLLYPLETRYKRPSQLEPAPAAIVMLTGIIDPGRKGPPPEFTDSADRFIEAVRLAYRYPQALLVVSGGPAGLFGAKHREGEVLGALARQLGVPAGRLLVDGESRNTRENAVFSDRLLKRAGVTGPVLLVTSALHMRRSVGCFEKLGRKVVPWPVDYLRSGWWGTAWLPKPTSLIKSQRALHEYAGWLSYKIAGYL